MHVIGFTQDIADLLATTDIFVTKPGPNSISEALQMNVPIIIATFGRTLSWEKFNITYITKHNYGIVAKTIHDVYRAIQDLLSSPSKLTAIKNNIKAREKKDIRHTIQAAMARILKNE